MLFESAQLQGQGQARAFAGDPRVDSLAVRAALVECFEHGLRLVARHAVLASMRCRFDLFEVSQHAHVLLHEWGGTLFKRRFESQELRIQANRRDAIGEHAQCLAHLAQRCVLA